MSSPASNPSLEQLVAQLPQLPPIAQVLSRLQRMHSDPSASLDDVAQLIRLDAGLTTRVIQISNSAWFGRGEWCATLEDAVSRIGFREIFRLVAVVATGAMVAGEQPLYRRTQDMIWDESVVCALAAELLAEEFGQHTEIAYTIGLLHGIGRQSINHYLWSKGQREPLADEGFPAECAAEETQRIGFHQGQIGAFMLMKWGFAPVIVDCLREQYSMPDPAQPMQVVLYGARLLRAIVLADGEVPETAAEIAALQQMKLSRDHLLQYRPAIEDQLVRIHQIARS